MKGKTSSETPFNPGKNGGRLRVGGKPGNKGGGRTPNWLKDWCDELLAKKESKAQVQAVLADSTHTAYASMWKAVADRAHGRPKESVELTGKDGGPIEVQEWVFGKNKVTF